MANILVKKGYMAVSSTPGAWLEARSLGSTLCVCVRDPVAVSSGMAVIVLPSLPPADGPRNFTGMALDAAGGLAGLFRKFLGKGSKRENFNVWLVGAARFIEEPADMGLGAQVYTAVKTILQKNGVPINGEHVGGPYNRSVRMAVDRDEVDVIMPGSKEVSL